MSTDIHKHRCGYHLGPLDHDPRYDPPLDEHGCGREWEHERIFKSKEDYANRHMCPNCGAGPWYRRVLTPLQRQQFEERIPAVIASTEDEAELAFVAGAILDALGFDEKRFQVIEARLIQLKGK